MRNSYTQHIKDQMISSKQTICNLLHWSETEYAAFQYKMGAQYLQSYIPGSPDAIDQLLLSRIFWNWWKNEWLFRDKSFVHHLNTSISHASMTEQYYHMHSLEVLIGDIYPGAAILNDGYANMIGQLNKSL